MKYKRLFFLFILPLLIESCNYEKGQNNSSNDSEENQSSFTYITESEVMCFYHPQYFFVSVTKDVIYRYDLQEQYPNFICSNPYYCYYESKFELGLNMNGSLKIDFLDVDENKIFSSCFGKADIVITNGEQSFSYVFEYQLDAMSTYYVSDIPLVIKNKDRFTICSYSLTPTQSNSTNSFDIEIKDKALEIIQNDCLYVTYNLANKYLYE